MSALGHWSFIEVIAHYFYPVCPCGQCQTVVLVTRWPELTRTATSHCSQASAFFAFAKHVHSSHCVQYDTVVLWQSTVHTVLRVRPRSSFLVVNYRGYVPTSTLDDYVFVQSGNILHSPEGIVHHMIRSTYTLLCVRSLSLANVIVMRMSTWRIENWRPSARTKILFTVLLFNNF